MQDVTPVVTEFAYRDLPLPVRRLLGGASHGEHLSWVLSRAPERVLPVSSHLLYGMLGSPEETALGELLERYRTLHQLEERDVVDVSAALHRTRDVAALLTALAPRIEQLEASSALALGSHNPEPTELVASYGADAYADASTMAARVLDALGRSLGTGAGFAPAVVAACAAGEAFTATSVYEPVGAQQALRRALLLSLSCALLGSGVLFSKVHRLEGSRTTVVVKGWYVSSKGFIPMGVEQLSEHFREEDGDGLRVQLRPAPPLEAVSRGI